MILYTILIFLGSDYFICMGGRGEGGGRFSTKKLGPIFFSETNIQDRVNSIVHVFKKTASCFG